MAAFVSKNPKTSAKETLNYSIYGPQCCADWCRRDVLGGNELVEDDEGGCKTGDVSSNI